MSTTERRNARPAAPPSPGVALIAAERARQVEARGFTAEHDDEHRDGALAHAAAFYVAGPDTTTEIGTALCDLWPQEWGEPSAFPAHTLEGRIRELTVGCALGAAELDRLLRLQARQAQGASSGKG